MSRFERAMLGLYGGAWLALLAVGALSLWFGRGFELLLVKDGSGAWAYLGLWAAAAFAIACSPRTDRGWRAILAFGAAGLLLIAGLGWWQGEGLLAMAMAASLIGIAAVSLAVAPLLDDARIQRRRPRRERTKPNTPTRRWHLVVAWVAWSLALSASFWSAWRGAGETERGSGAVLLLGVFFLALPAVVLGGWRRRIAAGWLVAVSLLALPFVAVAGTALVPVSLLLAAGAFAFSDIRRVASP